MTKDKFLFELIDRCMLITCQDNILAENFALRDDLPYYEANESQFTDCLRFYNEMAGLVKRGGNYRDSNGSGNLYRAYTDPPACFASNGH